MSEELILKLERQIAALKERMAYDANDLEYETHLHRKRELEKILQLLHRQRQG